MLKVVQKNSAANEVVVEEAGVATVGSLLDEIVRDGAARQRSLIEKGTRAVLPPGERDIFLKARQLLANEIGHVRGLRAGEADHWIDQQLAHA